MNAKRSNAQERKDTVLAIVVNEYIKTVNPVGSARLVEGYDLDVSSATIRNTLAELEEDGYLTHPHTSAGRVPTEKGYRYYVDFLMKEISYLEEKRLLLKYEYRRDINELDRLMEQTSIVLSEYTQYTTIITMDDWDKKVILRGTNHVVEYPDSQDLQKIREILRMLEEKEKLMDIVNRKLKQKIDIYIGHEMMVKEVDNCSLAISSFQDQQGRKGRVALLGPTRMDYQRVVSALNYVTESINDLLAKEKFYD